MDDNNQTNQEPLENQKIEKLGEELQEIRNKAEKERGTQPNQFVQEQSRPFPEQEVMSKEPEPQKLKKSKSLLWISLALLLLAVVGVGAYYAGTQKLFAPDSPPVPTLTPTPTPDPTAEWKTYTDEEVGFSLKYPSNVRILTESALATQQGLDLWINTTLVNEIEPGPGDFSKETAISDRESLRDGKYGEGLPISMEESESVVVVDGINAQTYVAPFSAFEVCSAVFSRVLVFYHNDYRVVLRLVVNELSTEEIKVEVPLYFKMSEECGDYLGWDLENTSVRETFYNKLITNELPSETANNWYNTFDSILSTIQLFEVTP